MDLHQRPSEARRRGQPFVHRRAGRRHHRTQAGRNSSSGSQRTLRPGGGRGGTGGVGPGFGQRGNGLGRPDAQSLQYRPKAFRRRLRRLEEDRASRRFGPADGTRGKGRPGRAAFGHPVPHTMARPNGPSHPRAGQGPLRSSGRGGPHDRSQLRHHRPGALRAGAETVPGPDPGHHRFAGLPHRAAGRRGTHRPGEQIVAGLRQGKTTATKRFWPKGSITWRAAAGHLAATIPKKPRPPSRASGAFWEATP